MWNNIQTHVRNAQATIDHACSVFIVKLKHLHFITLLALLCEFDQFNIIRKQ